MAAPQGRRQSATRLIVRARRKRMVQRTTWTAASALPANLPPKTDAAATLAAEAASAVAISTQPVMLPLCSAAFKVQRQDQIEGYGRLGWPRRQLDTWTRILETLCLWCVGRVRMVRACGSTRAKYSAQEGRKRTGQENSTCFAGSLPPGFACPGS